LFFTGGVLLGNLILHFHVVVDWLTFVFIMANFGALGSFAVFFTAPSIVKQGYLVCVSVIMAWSLSKMPDWTNWTILIALAVYDLFAVLSPCGPLKALVEMSQSRNEPIPGLVYEADAPQENAPFPSRSPVPDSSIDDSSVQEAGRSSGERDLNADARLRLRVRNSSDTSERNFEMQSIVEGGKSEVGHDLTATSEASNLNAPLPAPADDASAVLGADQEDEQKGVKLGLGDFVFYSVLVARFEFLFFDRPFSHFPHFLSHNVRIYALSRAASTNLTVVVTTFVAIIFGLCSTLVLLNIVSVLPASPIHCPLSLSLAVSKGAAGASHLHLPGNGCVLRVRLRTGTHDGVMHVA